MYSDDVACCLCKLKAFKLTFHGCRSMNVSSFFCGFSSDASVRLPCVTLSVMLFICLDVGLCSFQMIDAFAIIMTIVASICISTSMHYGIHIQLHRYLSDCPVTAISESLCGILPALVAIYFSMFVIVCYLFLSFVRIVPLILV